MVFEKNGKSTHTTLDVEIISEDRRKEIADIMYRLPEFKDVVTEMHQICNGSSNIRTITKYYFRYLMWDCIRHDATFSINEVLEDRNLLSYVVAVLYRRSGFFYPDEDIEEAVRKFFAMGGKAFAASVAQFPLGTANYIVEKYNTNNKWYDFSCGWGCRLTCAMAHCIDYYGTDPNYKLVDKLNQYSSDWKKEFGDKSVTNIYCQGSEDFIPELEGKIGLAFSSTPYFKLENYIYGKQSCNNETYDDWINNYFQPTIQNISKYLTKDGYFLCNIKNYNEYPMEEDTQRLAKMNGFELVCVEDLNLNTGRNRPKGDGEYMTTTEPIFVFKKIGGNPKSYYGEKTDLW